MIPGKAARWTWNDRHRRCQPPWGDRTPIVDQETLETGVRQWVVSYHESLMNGGEVATTIPDRLRRITVEEAAAIQSFPKDMPWHGSQSSRYHQIGNAVPPRLTYAVATSVARALGLALDPDVGLLESIKG